MDKTKDCRIPKCGVPKNLSEMNLVVGAKQLKKAVKAGRVRYVFLAENADPAITEPIEAMCLRLHIPCAWVPSMMDLGKACGIEVGAAAAAALR